MSDGAENLIVVCAIFLLLGIGNMIGCVLGERVGREAMAKQWCESLGYTDAHVVKDKAECFTPKPVAESSR